MKFFIGCCGLNSVVPGNVVYYAWFEERESETEMEMESQENESKHLDNCNRSKYAVGLRVHRAKTTKHQIPSEG